MKKITVLPLLLLITQISFAQTPFNKGYDAGFKAGYCYQESFCSPPMPPSAPLPKLNETTYQDGYNRGFSDGRVFKTNKDDSRSQLNDDLIKGSRDASPKYNSIDVGNDFDKGYERGQRLRSSYRNNKPSITKADKVFERIQKKKRKKIAKYEKKVKFKNVLFSTYTKAPWDIEVYMRPSLKSELKYIIKKERKVGVIEIIDDKWVKVLFSDGEKGYMMNTLLERKK